MIYVLYVLAQTVKLGLGAVSVAMLARALLSWIYMDGENTLTLFLAAVTEPFILPVRILLSRFRFVSESPIDISFVVTSLLIGFLVVFLPVPTIS